jgi:hypothetical protein
MQEAVQLGRLALGARERSAAQLMDDVRRTTGLDDYGSEPIEAPLARLLDAYRRDRRLNGLGRLATHWDNLRLLTNRLILRDREKADPTILERPVEAPIVIMGLPRSGTTFLHRLLSLDPESQALRCWQAVYPYPDHPVAGKGAGPARVQSEFSLFHRIAPEMKKVHPFDALAPQECVDFTAHSFRSLRFHATYDVPSYRDWLREAGDEDAYRLHRRFLQHLQGAVGRRWVLKSPDHVFSLPALRAVYPDARIVFSHRDPLKVLPSLAYLTEVWRRPFVRRIDRPALARQVAEDWADGTRRMIGADRGGLWRRSQLFHVHYKALTADPVGTVERLYAHFGLVLSSKFRAALSDLVRRQPDGGYARKVYRLQDFGLTAGEQREAYRPYTSHFGVEEEVKVA